MRGVLLLFVIVFWMTQYVAVADCNCFQCFLSLIKHDIFLVLPVEALSHVQLGLPIML